jgi:hypothetical protein
MGLIRGILNEKGQAFVQVIITPSQLYREMRGIEMFRDNKNHLGISAAFQYRGLALIDTGASASSLDIGIPGKLNLVSKGLVPVHTPKGHHDYNAFDIDLYISMGSVLSLIKNKIVIASTLKPQGLDMLIGTDILRLGKLVFERGRTFTFEI